MSYLNSQKFLKKVFMKDYNAFLRNIIFYLKISMVSNVASQLILPYQIMEEISAVLENKMSTIGVFIDLKRHLIQ